MIRLISSLFLIALLCACSGPGPEATGSPETQAKAPVSDVAAMINDKAVSLDEVDSHIKLGLYDLEWEKYQLRLSAIQYLTEREGGDVDIVLAPPAPPRLNISIGDRPVRGSKDAPVILSIFCSFQSSHCARLQPELEALMEDNGDLVALTYYDFPQKFHRSGLAAANAARCAFENGPNWNYLDSLFGIYDDLTPRRYELLARQSGLSPMGFKVCLDDNRFEADILDDINYAKALGFKNVPVVLINGLYVKGPKTSEAYQNYIDQELARLGVEKTAQTEKPAIIAEETTKEPYVPKGLGYDRVRGVDDNIPPRNKSQITLSRGWVTDHLRDEESLVEYFYKGEHKASGHHMLKLSDVSDHEFFQTMGLRTDDVIMQVNGKWVHDGQNDLWNDLRYTDAIEITLMRRGKPVTYYYKFGD